MLKMVYSFDQVAHDSFVNYHDELCDKNIAIMSLSMKHQ